MYYFSLIDNFESIITKGILSHSVIEREKIKRADFSNQSVQVRRSKRNIIINSKVFPPLHEFVPLYFVTKTPTLYAIAAEGLQNSIFFIDADIQSIYKNKEKIVLYTDGNAASLKTKFFDNKDTAKKEINFKVFDTIYWNDYPDGKRKTNAEILVHERVEPVYFKRIAVNNENLFDYIKGKLDLINWKGLEKNFTLEINPEFFF